MRHFLVTFDTKEPGEEEVSHTKLIMCNSWYECMDYIEKTYQYVGNIVNHTESPYDL